MTEKILEKIILLTFIFFLLYIVLQKVLFRKKKIFLIFLVVDLDRNEIKVYKYFNIGLFFFLHKSVSLSYIF